MERQQKRQVVYGKDPTFLYLYTYVCLYGYGFTRQITTIKIKMQTNNEMYLVQIQEDTLKGISFRKTKKAVKIIKKSHLL